MHVAARARRLLPRARFPLPKYTSPRVLKQSWSPTRPSADVPPASARHVSIYWQPIDAVRCRSITHQRSVHMAGQYCSRQTLPINAARHVGCGLIHAGVHSVMQPNAASLLHGPQRTARQCDLNPKLPSVTQCVRPLPTLLRYPTAPSTSVEGGVPPPPWHPPPLTAPPYSRPTMPPPGRIFSILANSHSLLHSGQALRVLSQR